MMNFIVVVVVGKKLRTFGGVRTAYRTNVGKQIYEEGQNNLHRHFHFNDLLFLLILILNDI